MKLTLVMPGQENEEIQAGLGSTKEAVAAAKEYLEDYFYDEILETGYTLDDDSFCVSEDWDSENTMQVHMVANSFGDLSDFYIFITEE